MVPISEKEEILRAAIASIPRVARAVVAFPAEQRGRAFEVAERSYLRIAQDLGYAEADAQPWVFAVIDRLRATVEDVIRRRVRTPIGAPSH